MSSSPTDDTAPPSPRPSWLLRINSFVVIVVSLCFTALALHALARTWDPLSFLLAPVFAVLPAYLGVLQYGGTFRRTAVSAGKVATLLYVLGGFLLFSAILLQGLGNIRAVADLASPPVLTLVLGIYLFWSGRLNREWSYRLADANANGREIAAGGEAEEDEESEEGEQRESESFADGVHLPLSRRDVAAIVASVVFVACLVVILISRMAPQFAEGVAASEVPLPLPAEASDVSYCLGAEGAAAAEFTIGEEDFRHWAARQLGDDGTLAPIQEEPRTVVRCYAFSKEMAGPEETEIHAGWFAQSDAIRHPVYAFDSETSRGYYYVPMP